MEHNKILKPHQEPEEENQAEPEEDLSLFQELPAIFQKDQEIASVDQQEKGNLLALILGSAGFLCLIIGLIVGFILFFC